MTVKQTLEAQEAGDKRNGETRVSVNEMVISLCEMSDEEVGIEGLKDEEVEVDLNDDSMIIEEEVTEEGFKTDMEIDLTEVIVKIGLIEEIDLKDVEIVTREEIEVDTEEEVIEVTSEEIVEVEVDSEILVIMIVLNVKLTKDPKTQKIGESLTLTVNQSTRMMEAGEDLKQKIISQQTLLGTLTGVNLQNHSQSKEAGEQSQTISL